MTGSTVPDEPGPERQAALILSAFSAWLRERPGRRIVLGMDGDEEGSRFRVVLDEPPRELLGETLQDSGAQAAQVLRLEADDSGEG